MPEIIEQQITLKYKIKEFYRLRKELNDLLGYYSQNKQDQEKKYVEVSAIVNLELE
ncbi:MAG: hypothetical protein ACXAC2_00385 [Candidatus Kariarchaeaceae archaeon]|jgi:hypothetical protein